MPLSPIPPNTPTIPIIPISPRGLADYADYAEVIRGVFPRIMGRYAPGLSQIPRIPQISQIRTG